MPYNPGGWLTINLAAAIAPCANISREYAVCVIVKTSSEPANMAVCSPV